MILFAGIFTHMQTGRRFCTPVPPPSSDTIFRFGSNSRGGKGVASAFGFILVINPMIALLALGTWLVFAFAFRYSSLAALAAAVLNLAYAYFYAGEVETVFFSAIALLVVLVRHHANIRHA